jgi:hypothetical protein
LRTYGVQRSGERSGAYNRYLGQTAPVLSRYTGASLSRIPVGRFFAVLLAPGDGLALFTSAGGRAAGSARAISSRHHGGDDRVCVAANRLEGQHGGVASGAVPGSARRGVLQHGFPVSPVKD